MKKLLSILAAVTLTATASTSVVACGSSSSEESKDMTSSIIQGGRLGTVDAASVLQNILHTGNQKLIFGDHGTALKTFLNYAAESFMKHSNDLKKISENYIKNGLQGKNADGSTPKDADTLKKQAAAAASYIDDGLWSGIKQDWTTRKQNADDAWTQAKKDAKSKYGKKWESSWLKDLKSQFGDTVYGNAGNVIKNPSYSDYKSLYVSYSILNGQSNGKSITDSLKDDIYLWGSTPDGTDISTIKNAIITQLFKNSNLKVNNGKTKIDFQNKNKTLSKSDTTSGNWNGSWLEQMDNLITGLQSALSSAKDASKMTSDDQSYLDDLINMVNATGGTNLESQIVKDGKVNSNNYLIGNAEWASRSNINDVITNWTDGTLSGSKAMAKDLIQRWDANYSSDFDSDAPSGNTNVSTLIFNSDFDVSQTVSTIYANPGKTTSNQINGLFSNAQRYVANDYYEVEKPVAVSELVVKPLYSSNGPDLDQFITNNKYVGTDANGNTGLMDSLYRFLGNFINDGLTAPNNKKFGGVADKADTEHVDKGTSNYSWDNLMKIGVANIHDVTTTQAFDSKFTGNVSFTSHANLLTRDSSSSDYSDILKYSVYDYLQKGKSAPTLKWDDSTTPTADSFPLNMSLDTVTKDKTANQVKTITPEYNAISNLVDELSRSKKAGATPSIYKVVNPQQGIIAFTDKDGIHFVRIEGYGLLDGDAKQLTTNPQNQLTVNNFTKTDDGSKDKLSTSDSAQDSYHAAQLLSSDLSSKDSPYATNITTDYMNSADYKGSSADVADGLSTDQLYSGIKYDDLNKSFGNTYLKFLANSSIAKSNGASGAKYSYDLNSELKNYIGADITEDNLADKSTILDMIWSYMSTITGLSDDQLFQYVETDGQSTSPAKSLLFDVLRNTNFDDTSSKYFESLYRDWIEQALLDNSKSYRQTNATENYSTSWGKADQTLSKGTVWTNQDPDLMDYHPSLTFKDADKSTSDSYYSDSADKIDGNAIWTPFSSSESYVPESKDAAKDNHVVFSKQTISEVKYQVKISKFIPNGYALKGDEE